MSGNKRKTYTKVCPVCGVTFEAHHKARIYCSRSCLKKMYHKKHHKKNRGVGKPKKRTSSGYKKIKPDQLCWSCQNACGGCSWSKSFTPVKGWKATPTKIKVAPEMPYCDSYLITACPEYIKDEKR